MTLPISLRTDETEKRYREAKPVLLKDLKPIKEFAYWVIVNNDYPYDVFFKTHHMLIPRREVASRFDLTADEAEDLEHILYDHVKDYHIMLDSLVRGRSIHNHYHLHLLVYKDSREEAHE